MKKIILKHDDKIWYKTCGLEMVRYSPSQVVANTPGVWLAFIASNLWSEDYQDFYADHHDHTDVIDDKIREIWSRCRTCFSKFDDPVNPHLGPWTSDRFCVEYIWTIIGSPAIINNAANIYQNCSRLVSMSIKPEYGCQNLTVMKEW